MSARSRVALGPCVGRRRLNPDGHHEATRQLDQLQGQQTHALLGHLCCCRLAARVQALAPLNRHR
eukprot:1933637-Prymnesium_polylepis.3